MSEITGEAAETAPAVQRPKKPRPKLTSYLLALGLIAFTVFAAREVGLEWGTFIDMWTNPLWEKFWPVPWDWVLDRHNVIDPLIETFQIAIISTIVGCSLALPVGFAMSKLTTPNTPVFWVSRVIMNIVRAISDFLWGKLLVSAIGIGGFGGAWALTIFSLAVMV